MSPETERELAHILLVELLAHQFAYPVRWIETQDVLLDERHAERIIEIGPSNVLTNMMRHTLETRFAGKAASLGLKCQLLDPKAGSADIYYTRSPVLDDTHSDKLQQSPVAHISASLVQERTTDAQPPETVYQAALELDDIPDVPVDVHDIVQTILAIKLNRKPVDVDPSHTIRNLVKGRSALSNEIVGDLEAEYPGQVPERSDDMTLDELTHRLRASHSGRLGKSTTSMVFRTLSSKFTGELMQESAVRQFLKENHGLGIMRQDAVLLMIVQNQPSTRLENPNDTKRFISEIARGYFQREDIPWPTSSQEGDLPSASKTAAVADAHQLHAAINRSTSLLESITDVLNRYATESKTSAISNPGHQQKQETAEQHALLTMLLEEHGEDYAEAIKPKFDARKHRLYNSYWNWCAQDAETYYVHCKNKHADTALLEEMTVSIANRTCDRSITQLNQLRIRAEVEHPDDKYLINAMWQLYECCLLSKNGHPVYVDTCRSMAPVTSIDPFGCIRVSEEYRSDYLNLSLAMKAIGQPALAPVDKAAVWSDMYPVSKFGDGVATQSQELTLSYARDIVMAKSQGFTFSGRNILITGAGKNSIGIRLLRNLLKGGARVTVTTSSLSTETAERYQEIYARYGSKESVLRVVPFNQGSRQDNEELVRWLYADDACLWDLDFIIPFAALSENGRDLENLDSSCEVAHRLMLTNVLRMLGAVASSKRSRSIINRPATVILPLSPNRGLFGNDGLYSESKAGLEPLLGKWYSESWADYLSIIGVTIGWCRGTGLMDGNNVLARAIESLGVKTFSAPEMAANIACLMGGSINDACQLAPLLVDLGGGLGQTRGISRNISAIRESLHRQADIIRAVAEDKVRDDVVVAGCDDAYPVRHETISVKANIQLPLPALPDYDESIAPLSDSLQGMVDLSRVVVITGFSELGPCGNSRTRWELEANGRLSLEGCVEMAWMMGMIRHHSGTGKDGRPFSGWVDVETALPIEDDEIERRHAPAILAGMGLRSIEPAMCDNTYDPNQKASLQEVVIQSDLPPFETTLDCAESMLRKHGDKVTILRKASGSCSVQLRAGATIMVPRSSPFNRTVAGQIPTGWSPKRYGISDDIIQQVDPVSLFSLVCTVEALLCSGIDDAYELYQHIHVSDLAICIGSSMGGLSSLRQMHRDRFLDKPAKNDLLQETFINTVGAWINMLLVSSAGPLKTPVGACATSMESLDTAHDLIVSGKAKVALVGGFEDFTEDVSFEFGSMNATCNTDTEAASGRSPREMSRPTASSRSGFVEAQGCGIQVVTSAELAIQMGLPIFGIVAHTSMSADKTGRSVPAVGQGVLTNAREHRPRYKDTQQPMCPLPPLLNLDYRRMMLSRRRQQIAQFVQDGLDQLNDELSLLRQSSSEMIPEQDWEEYWKFQAAAIMEEGRRQDVDATFNLGNNFWKADKAQRISPIRGALATWGLDIDDISVASLHGTSTIQNDTNEPFIIQEQMRHLGRQQGNLIPCVCQKWLTGHSKGAAGAWMVNGCLQMMDSGLITGNRNADNIDEKLRQHEHLWFPSTTLPRHDGAGSGIKACIVTCFGFGQKGSQAILVHPRFLYATLPKAGYEEYVQRRDARWRRACRSFNDALVREDMVSSRVKKDPPYAVSDTVSVLLDPHARFLSKNGEVRH